MIFKPLASFIVLLQIASAQTTWVVDTVAGAPRAVVDGIQATSSFINAPHGLLLDAAGKVVFSDTGNHRVRRITPAGAAAPSQVAGVFQLNIRVPVEAASGAIPVAVIVGTRVSSGNVTISIR